MKTLAFSTGGETLLVGHENQYDAFSTITSSSSDLVHLYPRSINKMVGGQSVHDPERREAKICIFAIPCFDPPQQRMCLVCFKDSPSILRLMDGDQEVCALDFTAGRPLQHVCCAGPRMFVAWEGYVATYRLHQGGVEAEVGGGREACVPKRATPPRSRLCCANGPDGPVFAHLGVMEGEVTVVHCGGEVQDSRTSIPAHSKEITLLALDRDGGRLVTVNDDGKKVKLFRTVDGNLLADLRGSDGAYYVKKGWEYFVGAVKETPPTTMSSAAFSPDNKLLAMASYEERKVSLFWLDSETPHELEGFTLPGEEGEHEKALAFSTNYGDEGKKYVLHVASLSGYYASFDLTGNFAEKTGPVFAKVLRNQGIF